MFDINAKVHKFPTARCDGVCWQWQYVPAHDNGVTYLHISSVSSLHLIFWARCGSVASGTKSLALALGILGLESQVLVDIAAISVTCRKVPLSSQFFATPLREVVDLPATSSRLADHISPCQLAECTLHIGQYRHWTETDRQTS